MTNKKSSSDLLEVTNKKSSSDLLGSEVLMEFYGHNIENSKYLKCAYIFKTSIFYIFQKIKVHVNWGNDNKIVHKILTISRTGIRHIY